LQIDEIRCLAAVVCCLGCGGAGADDHEHSFTVGQNIPQGDPSGLANTQTLNFSSVPNFSSIVNLTVTLDISGGFNGGYYAYLVNNSGGFAILLNRPGTTAGNSLGYADSGFNITLSDVRVRTTSTPTRV
jgi:spore coat protein U-like protein